MRTIYGEKGARKELEPILKHVEAGLAEADKERCRTPLCAPEMMEESIDHPDVCDSCRTCWLLLEVKATIEKAIQEAEAS